MKTRSKISLKKVAAVALTFFLSSQNLPADGNYKSVDAPIKYAKLAEYEYDKNIVAGVLDIAVMDMIAAGRKLEEHTNYYIQRAAPKWLSVDTKISYNNISVGFAYRF